MEVSTNEFSVSPYDFGKKFFPRQVNGKINTLEFLEASRGVVKLIDKLGKVFSPLSSDISGNIEKIKKCYEKDPSKYGYIEDMILCEKSQNNEISIDALLWLRRALHFILIFFQNIIDDSLKNECLEEHMSSAYSQALEPYHGWVTRKLFKSCLAEGMSELYIKLLKLVLFSLTHKFFKNLVPNRSALLSTITPDAKEEEKDNLIKFLKIYIQSLAENVQHITSFFKEHNLDSDVKV